MKKLKLFVMLLLLVTSGINAVAQCSMTYVSKTDATCDDSTGSVTFNEITATNWRIEETTSNGFTAVTGSGDAVTLSGLIFGKTYQFKMIDTDTNCEYEDVNAITIEAATGCDLSSFSFTLTPTAETCTNNGTVQVDVSGLVVGATVDVVLKDDSGTRVGGVVFNELENESLSYTFTGNSAGDYTVTITQEYASNTVGEKTESLTIESGINDIFEISKVDDERVADCKHNLTVEMASGSRIPTEYRIVEKDDTSVVLADW